MNPLSWITGIFSGIGGGGGSQPAAQTVNINTILAVLEVAQAFGVNLGNMSPQQMAAISALMAALGYAVPAPAPAPVPAHA